MTASQRTRIQPPSGADHREAAPCRAPYIVQYRDDPNTEDWDPAVREDLLGQPGHESVLTLPDATFGTLEEATRWAREMCGELHVASLANFRIVRLEIFGLDHEER